MNGTQTYFLNSPFYETDVFNFHSALRFYGNWSWLNADPSVLSTGEYPVFVVSERSANNSKGYYVGIQQGSPKGFHMGYKSNTQVIASQFNNTTNVGINAYNADESPLIHRAHRYASGAMSTAILKYGAIDSDLDLSTGGSPQSGQGRIGKGYDNNGFNGLISEVIIYNRVLGAIVPFFCVFDSNS